MRKVVMILAVLVLGIALVSACTPAASEKSLTDFYAEETVLLMVCTAPGGGTDYGARTFAAFWPEVTGGAMMVKNYPTAGGVAAINQVYKMKPDGLTLGTNYFNSMLLEQLFESPGVEYRPDKLEWIVAYANDAYVLSISTKLPYKSIDELKQVKGLKFGATDAKSCPGMGAAIVAELFQLQDAKLVTGFTSGNDVGIAVGRGELDGYVFSAARMANDVKKGWAKPFMVLAPERVQAFPDTPTILELLPAEVSPKVKQMLDLYFNLKATIGIFTSPGLSADKLKFIRDSFNKISTNESLVKYMKMQWADWPKPYTGEEAAAQAKAVAAVPKEQVAEMQQMIERLGR